MEKLSIMRFKWNFKLGEVRIYILLFGFKIHQNWQKLILMIIGNDPNLPDPNNKPGLLERIEYIVIQKLVVNIEMKSPGFALINFSQAKP